MQETPPWLAGHVESLPIPALTTARYDCPVCGAKNTFSVTDDGTQRLWYCFHADCNVKGRTGVTLDKDYAANVFKKRQSKPVPETNDSVFEIPHTFVQLSRSVDAELYLRKVGCYDAYLANRADIRYDIKKDRAVFLVKKRGIVVDAVGRLINGVGPKWYRYSRSKQPFICGDYSTAIVVEDCASACSCSNVATGVALLGTNLLQDHIDALRNYSRVIVALDKDATDKAIEIVRVLSQAGISAKLAVLSNDLKNMEKDERDDFLRRQVNR